MSRHHFSSGDDIQYRPPFRCGQFKAPIPASQIVEYRIDSAQAITHSESSKLVAALLKGTYRGRSRKV